MTGLPGHVLWIEGLDRRYCVSALEPVVRYAPPVAWQVFECIQAIEMIDWYLCDGPWVGQT